MTNMTTEHELTDSRPKRADQPWTAFQQQLEDQLAAVEKEQTTDKGLAYRALPLVASMLSQVQEALQGYLFTPAEEVFFYKEVKPFFIAQEIYYARLFQLENKRPLADTAGLYQYYHTELAKLSSIYADHLFIHTYLESGATHLDTQLFFHGGPIAMNGYDTPPDGAFQVSYHRVAGELLAAKQLKKKLLATLEGLSVHGNGATHVPKITFTGPNASLVELAYALFAKGCFNGGKAPLKDIIAVVEVAFNKDLGHFARTFQEIMYRKSGPSVFLDDTKASYLLYVDHWLDRQTS
jgi:hypothetical protein